MKHLITVLWVAVLVPAAAVAQSQEPHRLRLVGPAASQGTVQARTSSPHAVQADTTILYDSGTVSLVTVEGTPRIEAYTAGPDGRQANRFAKPPEGLLVQVSVAPYYENDFAGTSVPDSAARDFRLTIWADGGGGAPGDQELFTLDVVDDRANDDPGGLFTFLDIDLSAFETALAALPDTFYVGLANTGEDENYLAMGVSDYTGENVAFLYQPAFFDSLGGWRPFPALASIVTSETLQDRVLPIRAVFQRPDAPTAIDDAAEVPDRIVLHANFPNPFNPTTTIEYDLPQTTDVRLAVYDLLGREVALLVDALRPSGTHEVTFDAGTLPSGVYVYTIEAAGQRQTRHMVLIK